MSRKPISTPDAGRCIPDEYDHRLSQEEYQQLFQLESDAVILVDNRTECILEANAAATYLYGYPREELVGMRNTVLSAEPEKSRAAMEERCTRVPIRYHRKKDGSVFPVEIVASYFERQGRPVHIAAIRDITERKRIEKDLSESEARFRTFFEMAPLGLVVIDPDFRYVESNRAFADFVGYSREELLGMNALDLSHPEDKAEHLQVAQKARKGEISNYTLQKRYVRKNGEIRWGRLTSTKFSVSGSGKSYRMGIVEDITERKRAEDALRESEDRAKRALEANRTLAKIGRIVSSTLSVESVYDQFTLEIKKIIPSDRISIGLVGPEGETYCFAYTSGIDIPDHCKGQSVALPPLVRNVMKARSGILLHADEKGFPEEYPTMSGSFSVGIRSVILAPLLSKDEVIGALFLGSLGPRAYTERDLEVAEDVTRQIGGAIAGARLYAHIKQTEKSLRESEQRFRSVVELNIIGVVFVDPQSGSIIDANDEYLRIVGRSRDELESGRLNWKEITPPDAVYRQELLPRTIRPGQRVRPYDMEYLRPDGTRVPVIVGGSFLDEDRRRVVAFVLDMTERKLAEEEKERLQTQLSQAQKMESIGRLAGGVAHDFNNMLGIIIGQAEISKLESGLDDPLRHNLDEILKAAHRSKDTVRRLLAFARKQPISPKILDLNDTVSSMLEMLRRLVGEDINLCWIQGKDAGKVRLDPSQVNQILANLVVNSRDAIPGVGQITIETAAAVLDESYCREHVGSIPGEYVLLSVRDTGAGMSPEVMEHIFDPFFTTKEVGKGTGLGLATVYGIVKQNNGFIDVHSEIGRGTAVKMYFPRFRGEPVTVPEKAEQKPPRGTETVLLAEDESSVLKIAREILTRQGYTVLAARTPGEALLLAENHAGEIHLLLSDVVMPEMNGLRLLEKLRAERPAIKSLFMSGYTADVVAHEGVLDEGVNFIEKPFSLIALAEKVRDVLDRPSRITASG